MELKKRIGRELEVRCIAIVNNPHDTRHGMVCNRLLLRKNLDGRVACEIKCPRCGTLYDIDDEFIKIKEIS